MASIRANNISSVVRRLGLGRSVEVTEQLESSSGNVVIVRILSDKRVYNELELGSGRMAKISRGDVIVGALGERRAPRGFVGTIPEFLRVGDVLHLLNMGGVVGLSTDVHCDLGAPAALEVMGMAVRDDRILNLADDILPPSESLEGRSLPPIVMVSGSCMSSGKTYACTRIIHEMTSRGLRVHGGKLTGIACLRDVIAMEDKGAARTATFLDAGYPSTAGLGTAELTRLGRTLVAHLADGEPDVIVLELGDGIIGDYGVLSVLKDPQLWPAIKVHIYCAGDMVAAWGGQRFLAEQGLRVDVYSGPATDTVVGIDTIRRELDAPAINAKLEPVSLAVEVLSRLGLSDGERADEKKVDGKDAGGERSDKS